MSIKSHMVMIIATNYEVTATGYHVSCGNGVQRIRDFARRSQSNQRVMRRNEYGCINRGNRSEK